jgi:LAS superfamily LD-carboxypeptidase LdcB
MKGFFSFLLVLVMMNILFGLIIITQDTQNTTKKTNIELIALENASKDRAILENNVDKIIYQSLLEIALLKKTNLTTSKDTINTKLLNYLKNKAYATNSDLKNPHTLTLSYLNNSTRLEIYGLDQISYVNYYFTTGESLTNNISTELGNSIKLTFKIPKYYTQKVIG